MDDGQQDAPSPWPDVLCPQCKKPLSPVEGYDLECHGCAFPVTVSIYYRLQDKFGVFIR